jgi:hypothetical protein
MIEEIMYSRYGSYMGNGYSIYKGTYIAYVKWFVKGVIIL